MPIPIGVTALQVVGLRPAEITAVPDRLYLQSPERYEFFDITDLSKRYVIALTTGLYTPFSGVGNGGGVSAFSTLTGAPTDNAALSATLASKLNTAIGWLAASNDLGIVSSTPLGGTHVGVNSVVNNSPGSTTLTPAIDGVTTTDQGDVWLAPGFGGATTWTVVSVNQANSLSSLTDIGTFDLASSNPSLAAVKALAAGAAPASALAATNTAVATVKPTSTTWSATWDTSAAKDFGEFAITAALALTSSDVASTVGGYSLAVLISDGSHIPTFDGSTISNWTNVNGARNRVELRRVGNSKFWTVGSNLGVAISTPVAPVITSAPVLNAIIAGGTVSWTRGSTTGVPTPTDSFSLKKNGAVVSSPATSGSYSTITAGDIFILTQADSNTAGTASPRDSAPVTATASALRFASPTNYYPNSAFTQSLGTTGGAVQTDSYQSIVHTIGQDMTSMTLGMTMQWIRATLGISNVGNGLNVVAMSVIYNGTYVQVKSAGASSFTIADGANWLSDPIASSSLGGAAKFTKGTSVTIKAHWTTTAASTDKIPGARGRGTDVGFYVDPTKVTINNDVYSTGVLSYSMTNGGVNNTDAKFMNSLLPIFVCGAHAAPSVGFWGDSKTWGTNDAQTAAGAQGLTRSLFTNAATASTVQCSGINMGCPSGFAMECYTATAGGSVANHEFWYTLCSHAVVGYGTNLLSSSNQTSLYTRIRAKGIAPIIQRSLTPRTTSSDSWATTTNQTNAGSWGVGSGADNFEIFLRGNVSSDPNFTYYQSTGERASPTLGTIDYWKFAVNGTANYSTSDGLHEGGTAPGYELNIGTPGTVTTQAGGTVTQSLRALIGTLS